MSVIESLLKFLSMGGYGAYVWGAYGVTAALMVLEVVALRGQRATGQRTQRTAAPIDAWTRMPVQ